MNLLENETIIQGLSCEEELALIAKRFNLTPEETLDKIIHGVYMTEISSFDFFERLYEE